MQTIVGMRYVLSGGGNRRSNTRTLKKKTINLFKLVLLNTLRQSGTYKELYDYLSILTKDKKQHKQILRKKNSIKQTTIHYVSNNKNNTFRSQTTKRNHVLRNPMKNIVTN